MGRVWPVWLSQKSEGRTNFQIAIETRTWGFNKPPLNGTPDAGDYVLFGRAFSGGSPRTTVDAWFRGHAELLIGLVTGPLYQGRSLHWPDEASAGEVIYPHRFGWSALAEFRRYPLGDDGPLPLSLTSKLREVGVHLRSDYLDLDVREVLEGMEIDFRAGTEGTDQIDLGRTAGTIDGSADSNESQFDGQGRSSDAALNSAIERHAVGLAVQHFRTLGWLEIEELGKPYDLVCRRGSEELHVEVKGTTGSGASVLLTPNEVAHFRTCPMGADLVVVRDIAVEPKADGYVASGGRLLHIENYEAPARELQATGWSALVRGWDR